MRPTETIFITSMKRRGGGRGRGKGKGGEGGTKLASNEIEADLRGSKVVTQRERKNSLMRKGRRKGVKLRAEND